MNPAQNEPFTLTCGRAEGGRTRVTTWQKVGVPLSGFRKGCVLRGGVRVRNHLWETT